MPTTYYYSVNGRIVGEKTTGGSRIDYLTDALGSVTATVDQNAQVVNTYRYKPYGAQLAKTGAGADPKFRWIGAYGYERADLQWSDSFMRARHYSAETGGWTTRESPLGAGAVSNPERYIYVSCRPTLLIDPEGRYQVRAGYCSPDCCVGGKPGRLVGGPPTVGYRECKECNPDPSDPSYNCYLRVCSWGDSEIIGFGDPKTRTHRTYALAENLSKKLIERVQACICSEGAFGQGATFVRDCLGSCSSATALELGCGGTDPDAKHTIPKIAGLTMPSCALKCLEDVCCFFKPLEKWLEDYVGNPRKACGPTTKVPGWGGGDRPPGRDLPPLPKLKQLPDATKTKYYSNCLDVLLDDCSIPFNSAELGWGHY